MTDSISIMVNTVFTDKSGRQPYSDTETFGKLAFKPFPLVQAAAEDCISYPASELKIVKVGSGSNAYYSMRTNAILMQVFQGLPDALRGVQVAKQYTKQCFVGRNNTESDRQEYIMEYYK